MRSTKTRKEKGITLIALIITIVVLMVLAAVAISSIQNDGIIGHAENAVDKFKQEQQSEQGMLEYYEQLLAGTLVTVKDAQAKGEPLSTTENKNVYDSYGNKIVVPAGFKITEDADTVEEGIVIEDCTETATKGSQFVWIPVGDVKSSEGTKTINLGRYVFDSNGNIDKTLSKTNPKDQLKTSSTASYYYTEGLKNDKTTNAHALDIEAFITSATLKGGYYIGRYEARQNSETVTTVASHTVWNSVNQATASEKSKAMYGDANETKKTFSSDLINSYAWDTAIVFLQEFDDRDREVYTKEYSRQNSLNSGSSPATTGTQGLEPSKQDVICNIWDMASNCYEWSTETSSFTSSPCVLRGGLYSYSLYYTSFRDYYRTSVASASESFRPLLYVAL